MKKVLVMGISGSGKSTLSLKLGEIFNLPVYHLDRYFWKPGWRKSEEKEWQATIRKLVAGEKWIIDGNYSETLDIRLPQADTIIYLNFKTSICLWRILKRVLGGYNRVRPDVAEGCPERFDFEFILYVLRFRKNERPIIFNLIEKYRNEKKVTMLSSASQVEDFINNCTAYE